MYKSVILPLAQKDILEAAAWYNSKNKGLGMRFVNEIRLKVLFIKENPQAFAIRYDDICCVVLDVFPFMIHYKLDKKNNLIIVIAVFHTSLDPEKWRKDRL